MLWRRFLVLLYREAVVRGGNRELPARNETVRREV